MNGKSSTPTAPLPADPTTEAELYAGGVEPNAAEQAAEVAQAKHLAERYRLEFVDLSRFSIDHDLFRAIPADLMLRYTFVPYHREGNALVIVVSDPTDLPMIDELGMLLATQDQGHRRHAVGDPGDPEEERELDARPRRSDRELPAADPAGGRHRRRIADRRQADGRLEPGDPAGRHDDCTARSSGARATSTSRRRTMPST